VGWRHQWAVGGAAAWARAALQDFAAAVEHEAAAMWDTLTWVVAESLGPRPDPVFTAEHSIAMLESAARRWEALADRWDALAGRYGVPPVTGQPCKPGLPAGTPAPATSPREA
jgi:hypothetical protein